MMPTRKGRSTPRTRISLHGAARASIAAGPFFVLGVLLGVQNGAPGMAIPVTPDVTIANIGTIVVGIPVVLALVVITGAVIAILPAMIGTVVMAWLGDLNEGFRLPVMWALAGGFVGALFVTAISGDSPVSMVALAFTGACAGSICRWPLYRAEQR